MNTLTGDSAQAVTQTGFLRVDHIGIVVNDLDTALQTYCDSLGFRLLQRINIPEHGVEAAFLDAGNGTIELIASTDPTSGTARFLQTRGEGTHHICFEVEDIAATLAALEAVEQGYIQREIQETAYRTQRAIEAKEQIVVGVNRFQTGAAPAPDLLRVDESVRLAQSAALAVVRGQRDQSRVAELLTQLENAAHDPNAALMPLIVEAVEAYATLGEICDALRRVFGEYTPESWL